MNDIKNCPFCGHIVQLVQKNILNQDITYLCCDDCGLVASFRGHEKKNSTIKQWNRRECVGEI